MISEETRRKMSDAHIGKRLSEETRRKMSLAQLGKKHPHSPQTKEKLRIATLRFYASQRNNN